jgi:hypothetical protein
MKNRKAVIKIHELVVRIYVIPKYSHNRPIPLTNLRIILRQTMLRVQQN